MTDEDRILRRTYPTVAFTITVPQLEWLKAEATRRGLRSKSELLRDLIRAAMDEGKTDGGASERDDGSADHPGDRAA